MTGSNEGTTEEAKPLKQLHFFPSPAKLHLIRLHVRLSQREGANQLTEANAGLSQVKQKQGWSTIRINGGRGMCSWAGREIEWKRKNVGYKNEKRSNAHEKIPTRVDE